MTSRPNPPHSSTRLPVSSDEYPSGLLHSVEMQLKVSAIVTIAFALIFTLGSHDATDALVRWFSDVLFLRIGNGPAQLTDTNHLSDAILGGIMASWATFVWLLADRLLVRAPREVASIITIATLVWFPIDSIGSIASGAWLNVIANLSFLAMFLIPARRLA